MEPRSAGPSRVVVQAEALAWMGANAAPPRASVVTSLPDVSELAMPIEAWRVWFEDAARAVLRWIPEGGVAVFFQSDIRHGGGWVDKGHLVHRAADAEGATLLWRSTVCRKPAGTVSAGRPGTSHLMAFARPAATESERGALGPKTLGMRGLPPDVIPDAGFMPWSRAMGATACRAACRYLLAVGTTTLVDPFCGRGTALAVANAMGLDAIGVDVSAKAARAARRCTLPEGWDRALGGPSPRGPAEQD